MVAIKQSNNGAVSGHWTFRVPNVGVYSGDAGPEMEVRSARSVDIDFRGTATLRTFGLDVTSSTRQIRFQGEIDPQRHRAEATLRDGSDRFRLRARKAELEGVDDTMRAVERAILANDPAALYPTLNAQVVSAYSPTAFVAIWNAETTARGRITALRRTSLGQVRVSDHGSSFVAAEYPADLSGPSGPGTARFTAFFIHEPSGWKVCTTVRK